MIEPQIEGKPQVKADRQTLAGLQAWTMLCERAIAPSPRNFELLFTHFAGLNHALSESLRPFLTEGETFTSSNAETIYAAFIAEDVDTEALDAGANALTDVAHAMVEDIATNQHALAEYGRVLEQCAETVNPRTRIDDLMKVIATLNTETQRSAERTRALEQQLAASSVRITKLRHDLTEVRKGSTIDALTGIANRRTFDRKLRRALANANSAQSATFSLVLLDVDHFKRFNDTHGHRTGDQVLRLVGRLLSDNVKGRDTAARYGGEEFALIMADADLSAGVIVAEQIGRRLSSQSLMRRGTGTPIGQITISSGVAQYRPGDTVAALIERADQALYEAKRTGRNRVCAAA